MSDHDQLLEQVARTQERRRYGKYRGFVEDNEDPDKLGRLKLRVPKVYGSDPSDWALPCLPFGGAASHGLFLLPEIDDMVWVEFEEGDIDHPIWTGCGWPDGEVPEFGRRTLLTPKGHKLEFIDVDDEEAVILTHSLGDAKIEIDPKGTVSIADQSGGSVKLDAENEELIITDKHGNTITMNSDGITIEDANSNKLVMESAGITFEDANGNKLAMKSSSVDIS
jgi:uncharacterized protein involved in type VI secretion and phage assembly